MKNLEKSPRARAINRGRFLAWASLMLLGLLLFNSPLKASSGTQTPFIAKKTIAILHWENNADESFQDFVNGIPDMMMTNLGRAGSFSIIERLQVNRAMKHFALEDAGLLSSHEFQRVGNWLGADYILLGSFTKMRQDIRLDARLIDTHTGMVMTAESAGGNQQFVMALVDNLSDKILNRLGVSYDSQKDRPMGRLKITYKIYFSLLTSRPLYHQRCQIFLNGSPIKISPVFDRENVINLVLDSAVTEGSHLIKIVHYYVDLAGNFKYQMDDQPEPFFVHVPPNQVTELYYKCKVGLDNETFELKEKIQLLKLF